MYTHGGYFTMYASPFKQSPHQLPQLLIPPWDMQMSYETNGFRIDLISAAGSIDGERWCVHSAKLWGKLFSMSEQHLVTLR